MKNWFLLVAIAWFIFHFFVYLILTSIIPFVGFFPYKEIALNYHLPSYLTSLANFDGVHYLLIAQSGYNQYEQAFFPLYPLLINFLGIFVGKNYLLSGFLISTSSFFLGLFFFKNYLQKILENVKDIPLWRWAQLFLIAFPTSFFFTSIYTEGLFFLLFFATLYFLKKEKYVIASVLAFLTSLSRLVGVFLFIPIIFVLISNYKKSKLPLTEFSKKNTSLIIALLAPFMGLGSYCYYLLKTTGDPLFFLHSQSAFGANRSSDLILFPQVIYRYIKIFLTAQFDFKYFISIVEFSIFLLVLTVLIFELIHLLKRRSDMHFYDRISLNIFSFINILLPTFTGTFSSIPRYALMSFSFFIALAEIKNRYIKIAILVLFSILHLILFGFFMQGYFVS